MQLQTQLRRSHWKLLSSLKGKNGHADELLVQLPKTRTGAASYTEGNVDVSIQRDSVSRPTLESSSEKVVLPKRQHERICVLTRCFVVLQSVEASVAELRGRRRRRRYVVLAELGTKSSICHIRLRVLIGQ